MIETTLYLYSSYLSFVLYMQMITLIVIELPMNDSFLYDVYSSCI